jgi:DNA-binding NarL/FixJ family response regulator
MTSPISQPIRLLLVCSQSIARAGLRLLIEHSSDVIVVGEAANPAEAIGIADLESPDIILIDLSSKNGDKLDSFQAMVAASPGSRVLVLGEAQDQELCQLAVRLGATGVVFKDRSPEILIKAIDRMHAGEAWIDRFTIATVLTEFSRGHIRPAVSQAEEDVATLTNREREVITLVALGLRNKQIAKRLFISDITVRHHLTSAFSKLGVGDRFELMIYAYRHGLADLPVPDDN